MPSKAKHDHVTMNFPKGFLWGAATSAHQVEGNNINNDWWEWETRVQPPHKRSGAASDQYNRYEQDFELAKKLGHNAHRLSVEWSRIEPEEGKFNQAEIDHYKMVLKSLKERGMAVCLTLHHFTNPLWFSQMGGWENIQSAKFFERFVKRVVPEFDGYVDLWITINEPAILAWAGYLGSKFPPQKSSKLSAIKVMWNLAQAHKKAYRVIHKFVSNAHVGIAHNVISYNIFHRHSIQEAAVEWFFDIVNNHTIYKLTGRTHDFLGLNYYYNQYISFNGQSRIPNLVDMQDIKKDVSDLGWEIYPEGMFNVLLDMSDYHLPIYITENGIASTNDDRRVRFLLSYLKEVFHALNMGCSIKGYFHWSLIDNFEWADGFEPRFGLVEVDFKTQKRTPRPSALVYKEIIENNGIPHYLLKLLGHGIQVKEVISHPHDL